MDNISIIFVFINIFVYVNSFTLRDESLKDVIFKNSCNFPPRYLGDEYADKLELCSQQTPNAVMEIICGNIRLESNCDLTDVQALPSTHVTLKLFSDKGNPDEKNSHLAELCSYMENLPWSQENTCQDLCGNDAFFICDLYVAMDDALRELFIREVQNYTHLDTFIHPGSLKFLYPFPPIGALHSVDLLGNCRTPSQDIVTNQLCTIMAEVAVQYVKARLTVRLHEGDFVRNVSSNWDPCTGFSRFSNLLNSSNFISLIENCAQLCKDQLGVCKTIYLGLEKYQEAVSTQTSTATGSQLLNLKLHTKVMDSGVTGIDTGKESSVTGTKPVSVVGVDAGEGTGTGDNSQAVSETGGKLQIKPEAETRTDEGSQQENGTGKDSTLKTEAGNTKESLPKTEQENGADEGSVTETKHVSVVGDGADQESQPKTEQGNGADEGSVTETKHVSVVGDGADQESQPKTEQGNGADEGSVTETKHVSVVGDGADQESQPKTEQGNGADEGSITETKHVSVVGDGADQESQPKTEQGTDDKSQAVSETDEKLQAKPKTETGAGEKSLQGTGTNEGSQQDNGIEKDSTLNTEAGTQTDEGSQQATEKQPSSVVGTDTAKESQTGHVTETGSDVGHKTTGVSQGPAVGTKTTAAVQISTTSEFEYNFDDDYYDEEYPDVFREPSPAAGQLDRIEEQEKESFKPEKTKLEQAVYIDDEDEESSGSHFMAYFLVFIVLSIAGYIIFHNKQKIIALVVEGKSAKGSRRPSTKDYKQLKTEDVMPSLEKSAYSKDYVF